MAEKPRFRRGTVFFDIGFGYRNNTINCSTCYQYFVVGLDYSVTFFISFFTDFYDHHCFCVLLLHIYRS